MNFGLAYSDTIKKFSLKVTNLSNQSSVHRSVISRFRDARSIKTDNLERLVSALDDEAFVYWVSQIIAARNLQNRPSGIHAFNRVIEHLDEEEIASVLNAIASKLMREAAREQPVISPSPNDDNDQLAQPTLDEESNDRPKQPAGTERQTKQSAAAV
ncbi:hypothetical protein [Synechococcus sp. PCC 7335]|uniref:hypothetical protein n=1 Tax=Synechococcus sp. (strain ATCC 29403 / PCC 7335) TaxID=91464 RepID=UPI0012F97CCC|nr:hypothetical protein [Synechococcus sp. PCC 7335]